MFVRNDWVKNTHFHEKNNTEVLNQVIQHCKAVLEKKELPIVIFDLDSTLFNVSRRSYEILQEWMSHSDTRDFLSTHQLLADLHPSEMKYSLEDVWGQRKIPHQDEPYQTHFHHAKSFWRKRFFGNNYLKFDEPTPGAVSFVQKLHELGVKIVYLTGRDVPLMSFGTFDQLKKHQLPIETERTRLILKPKRHLDDLDFKSQAAALISTWGKVVASFENEPKNLVAMASAFGPEVMNVFIHSVSSDHPAPAGKNIYRIEPFEMKS